MVTVTDEGRCGFRVYLPHAGEVLLLGSFADWGNGPTRMSRDSGGWWAADVLVPPGEHEFSYLVDSELWMPDYAACGIKRNHAGNWISVLIVHEDRVAELPDRPAGVNAEPRDRGTRSVEPLRVSIRRGAGEEFLNTSERNGAGRIGAATPDR